MSLPKPRWSPFVSIALSPIVTGLLVLRELQTLAYEISVRGGSDGWILYYLFVVIPVTSLSSFTLGMRDTNRHRDALSVLSHLAVASSGLIVSLVVLYLIAIVIAR